MTVDPQSEEGQIIRQLIPLSTLPFSQFESVCQQLTIENAQANTFLFKKDDTANDLIYLIDGSINLQSDSLNVETVQSGTESARFALAHQIPRKIDGFSKTAIRFLRLSPDIINATQNISYEEEDDSNMIDDEDDSDWMTTLLKSPIFRALPPANLQQIIMSLQEVSFEKGDNIITQGEQGDYYYVIKNGHCLITRKPSPNSKEIKLAQLRSQDTFGEDSLLSGEPRNVNIKALTKVNLLRLHKDKFMSLIKEPSLHYINPLEIESHLDKGATLIDVRTSDEYKKSHIQGSINTPFFSLRMQVKSFNKKRDVIVICDDGNSSGAAAFLLLRHKINALIVKGGIKNTPDSLFEATAAFKIDDGIETLSSVDSNNENELSADDTAPPSQESANNNSLQIKLETENQQLKLAFEKLSSEKNELERRYRELYKQSEKLKAYLISLKK